jgi:hypothetical protein
MHCEECSKVHKVKEFCPFYLWLTQRRQAAKNFKLNKKTFAVFAPLREAYALVHDFLFFPATI